MKESTYNLCARDPAGDFYLFNTRRGTAHVMSARAYRIYWEAANGTLGFNGALSTLQELIDKGFLVEEDVDELSEVMSAHREARHNQKRLELLIAPSMACNLDCFYCFESNRYPGRMSLLVESHVARLVRSYFDTGTINLYVTWYGGEPLLAFPVIERLSTRFVALAEEFGCTYSAGIVTNGTLMTYERARRLASWNVRWAQITLDGVPDLHDARRIPRSGRPTFYKILDAIKITAAEMHVSVRINICRKTAARLEELLQILAGEGLNRMVSVYVAPLQNLPAALSTKASRPSAMAQREREQLDELANREVAEIELYFENLLAKYGFAASKGLPTPLATTCMADKEQSWFIEANGDIQKCYWMAGLGAEAVGHLTEDGIILRDTHHKWRDWVDSRDPACARCVFLPICLGRCPLKHLSHQSDYCPAFKHNWLRVLARAAGPPAGRLLPVQLPLAGENVKKLACAGR